MVHLYAAEITNLPDPKEHPELLDTLGNDRKEKTMKYLQAGDRKRSLGAGLLLKEILSRHEISTEQVHIAADGKPEVDGIYFNLSHSADWVICATGEKRTGCDIEKIVPAPDQVAERFFHPNEAAYLRTCKKEKRDELFFRLWTMKESYIKMTGEGMKLPLDSFELCLNSEKVSVRRAGKTIPCHIMEYEIPGYKVSVCSEENQFAGCIKKFLTAKESYGSLSKVLLMQN